MRIVINILFIAPGRMGGTETYVRNLINELGAIDDDNRYVIFTSQDNNKMFKFPKGSNFHKVMMPCKSKGIKRILVEQLLMPQRIRKHKLDVVHHPGGILCVFSGTPSVLTVHDLQHIHYPSNFSWAQRIYRAIFLPPSAKRASRITTNSLFTAKDVVNSLGINIRKIKVIHHSTTDNQFSENGSPKVIVVFKKYGLKIPYILSVANALPHKNLDGLLNGCVLLAQRGIKFELVLAGAPMKFHKKLRELIDSSPIFDRVKLLGYVPDSDLPALYRGATVYVFPSIFEGFGVPLIEAMITGIPVLAANRGALPEIAGGAAMLVDPDPQNLAKGLQKVLSDQELRSKMRNQGFRRAKEFTFRKTAEQTLGLIIETGNSSRSLS